MTLHVSISGIVSVVDPKIGFAFVFFRSTPTVRTVDVHPGVVIGDDIVTIPFLAWRPD